MTSKRTRVSLVEIERRWSLSDVIDAHLVENMFDDLDWEIAERSQQR